MVPTIWDGSFSGTLVVCNPDQIKIIGYDPNQLKESEPLAIQNYEGHELPVGVLQVCTELTGYMQLDLGGTEFLFRRNIHASYSGGSTFIDGNEYPEKVDLTFQNDGQTGTFPAEYFKLAPLPDSVRSSDIKVNVLRFDAGPGGRVTGEIQGSLYYLSGQTVPLSGRFNLNRQ